MIRYSQITTQDFEYEAEKQLRNQILRLPLGLQLSEHDVFNEEKQIHLVAMDKQHVIGCILIVLMPQQAKIRQMAIAENYQRQGIGTKLIQKAEQIIQAHKIKHIVLHARLSALGFYERLGYIATSGVFTEVTIDHLKMEKRLTV